MSKKTFLILFAANMVDCSGLIFTDADYKAWCDYVDVVEKLYVNEHPEKKLGLFLLWSSFLAYHSSDISIEDWNKLNED